MGRGRVRVRVEIRLGGEAEATGANGAEAEGLPCEEVRDGAEKWVSVSHPRHCGRGSEKGLVLTDAGFN